MNSLYTRLYYHVYVSEFRENVARQWNEFKIPYLTKFVSVYYSWSCHAYYSKDRDHNE